MCFVSGKKTIVSRIHICFFKKKQAWDFPGGTVVKNPPANAGDTGSSPGPGRSHMPQLRSLSCSVEDPMEQLSPCATTTEHGL